MVAVRSKDRVDSLHDRLREAGDELDQLRNESAHLATDLRNDLNRLAMQRQAVLRLDANRKERIEQIARSEEKRR